MPVNVGIDNVKGNILTPNTKILLRKEKSKKKKKKQKKKKKVTQCLESCPETKLLIPWSGCRSLLCLLNMMHRDTSVIL